VQDDRLLQVTGAGAQYPADLLNEPPVVPDAVQNCQYAETVVIQPFSELILVDPHTELDRSWVWGTLASHFDFLPAKPSCIPRASTLWSRRIRVTRSTVDIFEQQTMARASR
jgi:hypothetical protein